MPTADDIIQVLGLEPHPEGGYYRETFRDLPGDSDRAASTAIYFLLRADEISRWHSVDAVETWHWYAGAPMELAIAEGGSGPRTLVLGTDLMAGQRPQAIVPALHWQQARSLGPWTLVGCTVAPGFEFAGLEIAPDGWHPARKPASRDGHEPDGGGAAPFDGHVEEDDGR